MQNLAPFEAHLFTPWGTLFHKRLQTISKDFPPELVLDWIDGPQVWSLLGMGRFWFSEPGNWSGSKIS